jgi:hypothetical protein
LLIPGLMLIRLLLIRRLLILRVCNACRTIGVLSEMTLIESRRRMAERSLGRPQAGLEKLGPRVGLLERLMRWCTADQEQGGS